MGSGPIWVVWFRLHCTKFNNCQNQPLLSEARMAVIWECGKTDDWDEMCLGLWRWWWGSCCFSTWTRAAGVRSWAWSMFMAMCPLPCLDHASPLVRWPASSQPLISQRPTLIKTTSFKPFISTIAHLSRIRSYAIDLFSIWLLSLSPQLGRQLHKAGTTRVLAFCCKPGSQCSSAGPWHLLETRSTLPVHVSHEGHTSRGWVASLSHFQMLKPGSSPHSISHDQMSWAAKHWFPKAVEGDIEMAPRTSPPNLPSHVSLSSEPEPTPCLTLQTGFLGTNWHCSVRLLPPGGGDRYPAVCTGCRQQGLCSVLSLAPGCVHERGALSAWDRTSVFWVDILPDRWRAKRNKSAPWAESFIPVVDFARTGWEMAGVRKQSKRMNNSGHSLFSASPSVFSVAKHRAALTQGIDSVTEMLVCSHQRDRSEVLNDSIALLLRACQHSQSHKTDFSAPAQSYGICCLERLQVVFRITCYHEKLNHGCFHMT